MGEFDPLRLIGNLQKGLNLFQELVERKEFYAPGEMVYIRTANDGSVCRACTDLAAGSPYTIEDARGQLPHHPGCRCYIAPAEVRLDRPGMHWLQGAKTALAQAQGAQRLGSTLGGLLEGRANLPGGKFGRQLGTFLEGKGAAPLPSQRALSVPKARGKKSRGRRRKVRRRQRRRVVAPSGQRLLRVTKRLIKRVKRIGR